MYYIDQIKNFKNIQVLNLLSSLYFTNYNLAALTVTFSFPKCFKTSSIFLELKHIKTKLSNDISELSIKRIPYHWTHF
jgi:hypothetical protein